MRREQRASDAPDALTGQGLSLRPALATLAGVCLAMSLTSTSAQWVDTTVVSGMVTVTPVEGEGLGTEEPADGSAADPEQNPADVPAEEPTEEPSEEPDGDHTEEPTEEPEEDPTEEPDEDHSEDPDDDEDATEGPGDEPTEDTDD